MSIKKLRESKNMTQDDLGKELNVNRSTIAMWETGQSYPRAEKLIALSRILNCTTDELLGITPKVPENS